MNFKPRSAHTSSAAPRLQFTSLIDVIFLLLIYFVTTFSFAKPESDLSSALRSQRGGGRAADLQPQIVEARPIDGRPAYKLGANVTRSQSDLTSLLRDLPKEGGVFVKVDGAVTVGWVAGALQACHDAGFSKVNYVPAQ